MERKATFINQITRGQITDRQIDDVGDAALSFAEVKALATGNPLVLEKVGVDAEVARLARLADAHRYDQHRLVRTRTAALETAAAAADAAERYGRAIAASTDTHGDRFVMTVVGAVHHDRTDAGEHLTAVLRGVLAGPDRPIPLGALAGLLLTATAHRHVGAPYVAVTIAEGPAFVTYDGADLRTARPHDLVGRLERQIRHLDAHRDVALDTRRDALAEAARAQDRLGAPFAHQDRLDQLRRRQAEIEASLSPPDPSPDDTPGGQPARPDGSDTEPGAEDTGTDSADHQPDDHGPTDRGAAPDPEHPGATTEAPPTPPAGTDQASDPQLRARLASLAAAPTDRGSRSGRPAPAASTGVAWQLPASPPAAGCG